MQGLSGVRPNRLVGAPRRVGHGGSTKEGGVLPLCHVLGGANARACSGAVGVHVTAFIHARIELAPGLHVVVDGNSKITGWNGSYDAPVPNAFSLPAASVSAPGYCPRSTPTCRASCYVEGLAKHAPDVYEAYRQNADALQSLRAAPVDRLWRAADAFGEWIAANASKGFRWHVSGDVWDVQHACWIVAVCRAAPSVPFWIYTRTLSAVPTLVLAKNLAVNVSGDRDNYVDARDCAAQNSARLAYMATERDHADGQAFVPHDLPDGSVIFPDYPLRGRELAAPTSHAFWRGIDRKTRLQVCAADFFGQSEEHRCGPCAKCLKPTSANARM